MIGPPRLAPPRKRLKSGFANVVGLASLSAVEKVSRAISDWFWKLKKALPDQTLPPDLVVAVISELDAFWYSALKFWLMTRYSWIEFRGNGLPRLASWPATPPPVRSFLRLVPSMNTLTALALWPPPWK